MRHAKDISQSELARAVGIKPQSIQYLLDTNNAASGSKHTASIAKELGVSTDWLANGQGSMLDRVGVAQGSMALGFGELNAVMTPPPSISYVVNQIAYAILLLPEHARAEISPHLQALCLAPDSETLKKKLVELLDPTYPK